MSRLVKIVSVLLVLAVLLLLGAISFINSWLNTAITLEEAEIISIERGDNLSKLAYRLAAENKLSYPALFIQYAKWKQQTQVKVGEYQLPLSYTPEQLLNELQNGKVISYSVTLIEGKTFKDYLAILARAEKLDNQLSGKNIEDITSLLGLDVKHPEGWFYPDTYQYIAGASDIDILKRAHKKMQTVLDEQWQQREKNLPYKNAYEALIMASIIEKETGVARERPEIAGVFIRRLQKGMRLQTDPTVIYGMGDRYKGNIRRKDLREPTPYNTYVIPALPPTPIAMPATASIYAALHPAKGKALFFVGKGDGSHYFSETLAEHNKAVQQYQINQRAKNYRSAPGK